MGDVLICKRTNKNRLEIIEVVDTDEVKNIKSLLVEATGLSEQLRKSTDKKVYQESNFEFVKKAGMTANAFIDKYKGKFVIPYELL